MFAYGSQIIERKDGAQYEWGGEITSKYFVCTCVLIYILLWFMQIMKKKEKERKKLKSHKCFWRTQNTLVLLHSEIPQ